VAAEYHHPHTDAHDGHQTDIVISSALSKDELRTIVNESRSQISRRNQDMLLSVLDLEKVSVNDIMVPRNEIVGIDINDDWKSIVRQLTHSPHGRIVLYRDSLDDAISMLRVREAYRLMTEKKSSQKRSCCARQMRFTLCRKARRSARSW
jgi:Mg2+/Co2+ transporter CorB